MTREDAIRAIRLFIAKADKLESLEFVKLTREGKRGVVMWPYQPNRPLERAGPGPEAIDAFVLTFRFFIQNNEPVSFGNLPAVYEAVGANAEERLRIAKVRTVLNGYLDGESSLKIHERPVTERHVLDVFMWGGLAHSHHEHTATFERWQSSPMFLALENHFTTILETVMDLILWVREYHKGVLARLEIDVT